MSEAGGFFTYPSISLVGPFLMLGGAAARARHGSKSKRSIHDESMTSQLHSSLFIVHKVNNNTVC